MLKKFSLSILILIFILCQSAIVFAEPSIKIDGKSAILIDADTKLVVFEINSKEKMPVASINKIMTLLLAFEAIDKKITNLDDMVQVTGLAPSI